MTEGKDRAALFRTESGTPMSKDYSAFFIDRNIQEPVSEEIRANGGEISLLLTDTCVHLVTYPPKFQIRETIIHPIFSVDFVADSVRLGFKQELEEYRVKSGGENGAVGHKRKAYVYEEECRMNDYVLKHPGSTTSLSYWVRAQEVLGRNHSAESLRFHYVHYTSKLKFPLDKSKNPWEEYRAINPPENEQDGSSTSGSEDNPQGKSPVRISVWPQAKVFFPPKPILKRCSLDNSPPRKLLKEEDPKVDPEEKKSEEEGKNAGSETPSFHRDNQPELSPVPEAPGSAGSGSPGDFASHVSDRLSQLSISPSELLITTDNGKREVRKVAPTPSVRLTDDDIQQSFQKLVERCREGARSQISEREVLRVLLFFNGDVESTLQFYSTIPS